LAQYPQKILDSAIHKHCSNENPLHSGGNPAAWYSNNARQPVITPNALSVNKIACQDALQIHSHTHPSLLISSPALRRENPKAMDKGKQPQEDSAPKKRTIRE
jgi:hypothetical protein